VKKFILPEQGNFYKANLHCHTTFSDGRRTPAEIKEIYKKLGFSIVAYTEHEIMVPHPELNDESFLALNGFEASIDEKEINQYGYKKCCHICFVALEEDNVTQPCWNEKYVWGNARNHIAEVTKDENEQYVRVFTPECINDMIRTGREKGFFVTYNHPTWSLEDYTDYMQYEGMHAFEMFNGSSIKNGYEDYNPRVYDDMLRVGKRFYCIGADDNHNHAPDDSRYADSGWAYITIKADKLEYRTITKALEDGHFYSSEGPEIYDLWYEDGKLHVRCSEADRINCTYNLRRARTVLSENGVPVTEATFDFEPQYAYARITVIDKQGRRACTNAIFRDELETE
jgi:hypothetical protein